jgi:hypothetical protein
VGCLWHRMVWVNRRCSPWRWGYTFSTTRRVNLSCSINRHSGLWLGVFFAASFRAACSFNRAPVIDRQHPAKYHVSELSRHWRWYSMDRPNKSVQATTAARFRFLALVVFIRSFCRSHPSPAAVPDLCRSAQMPYPL